MRLNDLSIGLLALALCGAPAFAQSTDAEPPEAESLVTPDTIEPQDEAGANDAVTDANEATAEEVGLEVLFERLQAENDDWSSTQSAIIAVWSRSGSDSMDLLLSRGRDAMAEQEMEKAISHFTELVELAPDFAEGWNARATAYFLDDQYGPSISDIAQALALEPRHFGALAGLGMMFEAIGDKKNALRAYREGLAVHPHMSGPKSAVERLTPEVEGQGI